MILLNSRKLLWMSTALAALGLAGCVKPEQRAASVPKHLEGEPTRGNFHLQWISEDLPDFLNRRLERDLRIKPAAIAPRENPLTQRIQYWVDTFHNIMVEKYPDAMKHTPKPMAMIVKDPSLNAFVYRQPQCANVKVRQEGTQVSAEPSADTSFHLSFPGQATMRPASSENCGLTLKSQDLSQVVALFNAGKTACSLKIEDGGIIASEACFESETDPKVTSYLSWSAEANFVFVNTGAFLKVQSESDLVAIVGHELGHYYRTHNISFLEKIGFFYRRGLTNEPKRPTADESLKPLADKVLKFYGYPSYREIEGQALHSAVMAVSPGLDFDSHCETDDCKKLCSTAENYLDNDFDADVLTQVDSMLDSGALASYRKGESLLLACLAAMPVEENTMAFFKRRIASGMNGVIALKDASGSAMDVVFQDMSRQLQEFEQESAAIFAEAARVRLGYYTHEQEADEISLELLANAGLKPELAYGAYLSLMRSSVRPPYYGDYSVKQCEAYFANGWKDENGKAVDIPVGSWNNAHHSLCYRIYNLSREVEAHQYQVSTAAGSLLSSDEWQRMREEATKFNKGSGDEAEGLSTFLHRRQSVDTCEFARGFRGE